MTLANDFRRWLPQVILGWSLLTALVVFAGILPQWREAVVLIFYVTCPGLAYVRLFRLKDLLAEVVLTLALSLAIDSVAAMLLLYTGAWSYVTGLLLVIAVTLVGILANNGESDTAAHTPGANDQPAPPPAHVTANLPRSAEEPPSDKSGEAITRAVPESHAAAAVEKQVEPTQKPAAKEEDRP